MLYPFIKPNEALFLADFETTGFADDPKAAPIELAGLFLDHNLNVVDEYGSLINYMGVFERYGCWSTKEQLECYAVHGIDCDELQGKPNTNDVSYILSKKVTRLKREYGFERIIFASDNPYFDFTFIKKFEVEFHYNPYDVKGYIAMSGCKRPDKETRTHRAMDDVRGLYEAMLRAKKIYQSMNDCLKKSPDYDWNLQKHWNQLEEIKPCSQDEHDPMMGEGEYRGG